MIQKAMIVCFMLTAGFSVFAEGIFTQKAEKTNVIKQEVMYGEGISVSTFGTLYYNTHSIGIGAGFQAGKVARITVDVQSLLRDSYEGIIINTGAFFGVAPSINSARIYGGPQVSFSIIKDKSLQISLGGKGGCELFVNPHASVFFEVGAIAPVYRSSDTYKLQSVLLGGGFRFFF